MAPNVKNKKMLIGGAVIVVLGVIAYLIGSSFQKLTSEEVGLMYNQYRRKLSETPRYEGLHTGAPNFKFIKFPSIYKTFSYSDLSCLNQDGVKIKLDISYQSRVYPANLHDVVTQFQDHEEYRKVLELFGASTIHEVCSEFNTSQFQSERVVFSKAVYDRLKTKYSIIYSDVTDLQVKDIRRPEEYEKAVRAKESSREDIQVARQERDRQLVEAVTKRREAETQARITINRAKAEAQIIEVKAQAEAEAITREFQEEAAVYKKITTDLGYSTEAFLSYMGTRVLESTHSEVYVNLDAPAKSSYITSG